MLEGIVTEKRFQMSFEYSPRRVASTLRAELHAAGLNRGEISFFEFVLLNRSATLTGGYRINVDDWVKTENERLERVAAENSLLEEGKGTTMSPELWMQRGEVDVQYCGRNIA